MTRAAAVRPADREKDAVGRTTREAAGRPREPGGQASPVFSRDHD